MPCEVSGQLGRAPKGVCQAHWTVNSVAVVRSMSGGLVLRPVFHTVVELVWVATVVVCAYIRPQIVYKVCPGGKEKQAVSPAAVLR